MLLLTVAPSLGRPQNIIISSFIEIGRKKPKSRRYLPLFKENWKRSLCRPSLKLSARHVFGNRLTKIWIFPCWSIPSSNLSSTKMDCTCGHLNERISSVGKTYTSVVSVPHLQSCQERWLVCFLKKKSLWALFCELDLKNYLAGSWGIRFTEQTSMMHSNRWKLPITFAATHQAVFY